MSEGSPTDSQAPGPGGRSVAAPEAPTPAALPGAVRALTWALAAVAVGLSLWAALDEIFRPPVVRFDDSYMFLRYAKHLLAGEGHVWNLGEAPAYGSTSLLYVLVVTLLRALSSLDDPELLRASSAGFGGAAALVMVLTAWRFSTAPALRRNLGLWLGALVPPVITSGVFLYHARTGMDTTLSLLMNALLVHATLGMVERGTRLSTVPVSVVAWLAYLTRPDNGLFAALVPTLAVWFLAAPAARKRLLVTYVGTMVGVLVVDTLAKVAYFGVPLPLPVYAKAEGHYADYAGVVLWNPMAYLTEFLVIAMPFLCVVAATVTRETRALAALLLGPVALTLAAYFQVLQIMGYRARFAFPSLPFVVAAAVLVLDRAVASGAFGGAARSSDPRGARPVRPLVASLAPRLVAVLALVTLLPLAARTLPGWWEREHVLPGAPAPDVVPNPGRLPELPYWSCVQAMSQIARQAPEGALLAMSEYGAVGNEAPDVAILDPLGLHDREVAREGFSAERFVARAPDVVWMPHPDYVTLRRALLRDPGFREQYEYFPAALQFGLAVRKTGPRAEAVGKVVREVWGRFYPGQSMRDHRLDP